LRDDSALHGPAATGWPSSIGTALGGPLVDIRIRLLEAIGRDGPISRAANAVPMSGKAASPLAAKLRRSLQTSRSLQMTPQRSLVLAFLLGTAAVSASADEGQIAVAANFTAPMKEIIAAFEADSGHKIQASYGSTGKLYAQIKNGAPFQALLAADQKRPALLAEEGVGEPDSRFTYAIGTLVFWSADPDFVDSDGEALKKGDFEKLSLANPKLAPYGEASIQTLEALGLKEEMEPRFVMGENIAQTYQFVDTGNAKVGFVALSQVMEGGKIKKGSGWIVPGEMHAPIRQDAIILNSGANNAAIIDLFRYLKSEKAHEIIHAYGYQTE
jgi:molybdate transport system substrate-binding protein